MKNLWLHGFYLTVIGVLGFQLWAKTTAFKANFKQVEQVLDNNYFVLNCDTQMSNEVMEKQFNTNPSLYGAFLTHTKEIAKASKEVNVVLSKNITESKLGKNTNIGEVRNSLKLFYASLISTTNGVDSIELQKKCGLNNFIQNENFWKDFDRNQATFLLILINQVKLDEIKYLNYFQDKVSGRIEIRCSFGYHIGIMPKKAVLIEGEKFEADVCLMEYYPYSNTRLSFVANNESIPVKDGIGHFSKTENTTGLKTFKVNANIKNPATGEIVTTRSEYEYHVLPKCSQNCQ